jgi:DNA replication initiation complex subunit (GINS family)
MKSLDENALVQVPDETEAPGELTEEEKDFLKRLEEVAGEAMDDAESSK